MELSPANSYYLIISTVAFAAMGIDKIQAKRRRWRISEKILLVLAFMGGVPGTLLGMIMFRHKINKPIFYLGMPILYLLHRVVFMPLVIRLLIEQDVLW